MMCYASRTGTRRNIDAMRAHGWGIMVSPAGDWRTENFQHVAADNGAWTCYQTGRPFDEDAYDRFLGWLEAQAHCLDWLVVPDIVAGGLESLDLSLRYLNRCLSVAPMVLIAVQDGMEPDDLAPFVGQSVGIFLGGSTTWKLQRMFDWGQFCRERGIHYHVARVNTARRMYQAIAAGADSSDGSSASRYACTTPMLTYASRQLDFSEALA